MSANGIVLLALVAVSVAAWFAIPKPLRVFAWRWSTGAHLDGVRRTDGTFLRPGRRALDVSGRASRWQLLPGWQRAGTRWASLTVTAGGTVSYIRWPEETTIGAVVAAVVAAGVAGWRGYRSARRHRHYRDVVLPLHVTLGGVLGVSAALRPDDWIDVPAGYLTDDSAVIRVTLPAGTSMTQEVRRVVGSTVVDKIGGGDWTVSVSTVGVPRVELRHAPKPPGTVGYTEIRRHLDAAPDHAPVIGLGAKGAVITADYKSDSPHVAVSGGSGAGKSVVVKILAAQCLRHGGAVVIVDVAKRGASHSGWARGTPNVRILRTPEAAHDALVALGAEMERRYDAIDADPDTTFPRIVIVAEEMNASIGLLSDYWTKIREKSDPKSSPALDAFKAILFAGRQSAMTVIAVAQMLTARAIGGPEARENFSSRLLARYTVNAWKMLAPEVWPMPRKSTVMGRWQYVANGAAHAVQVAYLSDHDVRSWVADHAEINALDQVAGRLGPAAQSLAAAPGSLAPVPRDTLGTTALDQGNHMGTVPMITFRTPGVRGATPLALAAPPDLTIVRAAGLTLGAACRSGILPMTYDAAKKARARDPEFPAGTGDGDVASYTEVELRAWFRNRARSARAG